MTNRSAGATDDAGVLWTRISAAASAIPVHNRIRPLALA
jgi:hypothetical protein